MRRVNHIVTKVFIYIYIYIYIYNVSKDNTYEGDGCQIRVPVKTGYYIIIKVFSIKRKRIYIYIF